MRVITFEEDYRTDPATGETVRDDRVLVSPIGNAATSCQTWHRLRNLDPARATDRTRQSEGFEALVARWEIIKPKYDAWVSGDEIPLDGTPLGAWSAVTPRLAAQLSGIGITTIEGVRDDLTAEMCKGLGAQNAHRLPEMAEKYLDGMTASAALAEKALQETRLEAIESALGDKDAQVAALMAQLAEAKADPAPEGAPEPAAEKRGPGRPRKPKPAPEAASEPTSEGEAA